MNMQFVHDDILKQAAVRMDELQGIVSENYLAIQNVLDSYSERRERAKRRSMTKVEFNVLYPNPPFIEEDTQIVDKKAKHEALLAEFNTDPGKRASIAGGLSSLAQERHELEMAKAVKLNGYYATRDNPHRSLTDEEFVTLYPASTDADFANETAAIADARVEANKLHSFFKSGPYPQPGLYDVDLLNGTAITYP
ncbi:hypothetical protein [Methylobacter sp. BlB1]|jgi:hypothetical protein|uniref:hypothetical protein n=1 Tax=Methylobacter sp. BlB1 TaxID=2785914 RepID=UPI00189498F6|nr:hypothetical protein [Methylobacter sp. BlB1]MBF6649523.1 hypothetical protein [Methylobacter sp. BlB1]